MTNRDTTIANQLIKLETLEKMSTPIYDQLVREQLERELGTLKPTFTQRVAARLAKKN